MKRAAQVFAALSVIAATTVARAGQVSDGACPAPSGSSLEDLTASLDSIPTTIRETSSKISLCSASDRPVLTFDAELDHPVISLSIPLARIPHTPMTDDQFAAAVTSATIPAPWSFGSTTSSVKDGKLVLSAPAETGAWGQVPGVVDITLKSGQHVLTQVSAPMIDGDMTANERAGLAGTLGVRKDDLAFQQENRDRMAKWIADPSSIPFSSEAFRQQLKNDIATQQATLASLRSKFGPLWSAASTTDKAIAYSRLGNDDPAFAADGAKAISIASAIGRAKYEMKNDQDVLDVVNTLADPPADVVAEYTKKIADEKAAIASGESDFKTLSDSIGARASQDALFAAAEPVIDRSNLNAYSNAMNMLNGDTRNLASVEADAARERADRLAGAKAGLPDADARIAADKKDIESIGARLADTSWKSIRTEKTSYDAGCPSS